ncbi:CDP-alcohol phosphatidyltransferase family protein [Ruminiclostridium cellobioparum]|uniref:Phosphatidylglycerophosphate synthase n=1 Tax=Ruminiclostridium cellobioparum subsp. termitidis CT1112 TaxID=1195236 RepID=S0FHP8_RUMCE|nr:CDP-alcohol phosphatidyltransferase family protein [Ruminiclostridium cellobioparum]EMS69466.1 Phosphatidylglycerophosphate synthase [Ruminiclostridium cellobioparum subsp. termitidis CT1112]
MKPLVFVNSLTLSRIFLSVLFYWTVSYFPEQFVYHILIFAIIFLTDFFDGRLARQYNVETRAGAVFDVVADLFFVTCSFAVLIRNNILPFWILIVAIVKFAEFWVSSMVSAKKSKTVAGVFIFDGLGKAAALLLYALSAVGIMAYVLLPVNAAAVLVLFYCGLVTLMAAVSSVNRVYLCIK